jgi:hypothetical protein
MIGIYIPYYGESKGGEYGVKSPSEEIISPP